MNDINAWTIEHFKPLIVKLGKNCFTFYFHSNLNSMCFNINKMAQPFRIMNPLRALCVFENWAMYTNICFAFIFAGLQIEHSPTTNRHSKTHSMDHSESIREFFLSSVSSVKAAWEHAGKREKNHMKNWMLRMYNERDGLSTSR